MNMVFIEDKMYIIDRYVFDFLFIILFIYIYLYVYIGIELYG